MFQQIFYGILGIAIGSCFVAFARNFVDWFGLNGTMERYLGSGGTYTGLRLIGILTIVISFLYMTGLLNRIFGV